MQEPLEGISFNFDFICLFTYVISLWYVENARCINKRDARPWCCVCVYQRLVIKYFIIVSGWLEYKFLIHHTYSGVRPHLISALYTYTMWGQHSFTFLWCIAVCWQMRWSWVDRRLGHLLVDCNVDGVVLSDVSVTCRPMRCRDQIRHNTQ